MTQAPAPTTTQQRQRAPAEVFRATVASTAKSFLVDLVGEERARDAAGRMMVALRQLGLTNPQLYQCTQESIAQAIAMCALTGLMPGGAYPGCYLIPRKMRAKIGDTWQDVLRMNWQMSWRGMLTLAKRAGWDVRCYPVHRGEPFEIAYDPAPRPVYRPSPDVSVTRWEDLRGCVVYATHRESGQAESIWVPIDIIESRRAASDSWARADADFRAWEANGQKGKAPQPSVWHTWPIEMAMKAAIRYAVSRGLVPLDDDWQIAEAEDIAHDRREVHDSGDIAAIEHRAATTVDIGAGMSGLEAALADEPAAT